MWLSVTGLGFSAGDTLLIYKTYFESHELVIWFGSPGVDLHSASQGGDQELDLFIAN